jgi:predicted RNase H-like HicB family nuclease
MEAKYEIVIYWSKEDQFFIAEVPELPGCMADGVIYAEALQKCRNSNHGMDRNCKVFG